MPKVSVVLPVYNGGLYVSKSIESVLTQTYTDLELIIVNDCSTDNTLEIAKSYERQDNRVHVLSNQKNEKLPNSLNNGFREASGKYLTWTSDDNTFHQDAIKKMVGVLEEKEEIDLVYADYTIVDMNGNKICVVEDNEVSDMRYKDIVGACFIYRKELADKVGEYDAKMILAEDYDFFLRCYKEGNFYHLRENLYNYGRHEKNLSATKRNEIYLQAYNVMNKHLDFLYSCCKSRREKNRLFWEMLMLLEDNMKKENARLEFYSYDSSFKRADKARLARERVRDCYYFIGHKLKKVIVGDN